MTAARAACRCRSARSATPWAALALLAAAGIALPGCGAEEDPCVAASEAAPAAVLVGAPEEGGAAVEPLADGDRRPLVRGSQAGFHVWLNVRATGLCPRGVRVARRAVDAETGAVLLAQAERADLVVATASPADAGPAVAGTHQLAEAFPLFLCPHALGAPVRERPLRVEVTLTDVRGATVTATRALVPVCDPATQGGAFLEDCRCACQEGAECAPPPG